jgi:uncharacterized membrane protein
VQPEEIIRQRVDFLKIEYEQLREHNDHLENAEWKVRQLCITLWLATLGVGLGLQGVTSNNFYILVASLFIPYTFLFIDARIGRWIESHRVRRKQIDLFLSNKNYSLPSTGTSISFIEFCSDTYFPSWILAVERLWGIPRNTCSTQNTPTHIC